MPLELSNGMQLSDEDLGALMDEMERIGSSRAEDSTTLFPLHPVIAKWRKGWEATRQLIEAANIHETKAELLPDVQLLLDALRPFAQAADELEEGGRSVLRWGLSDDLRVLSATTEDLRRAKAVLDTFAGKAIE